MLFLFSKRNYEDIEADLLPLLVLVSNVPANFVQLVLCARIWVRRSKTWFEMHQGSIVLGGLLHTDFVRSGYLSSSPHVKEAPTALDLGNLP